MGLPQSKQTELEALQQLICQVPVGRPQILCGLFPLHIEIDCALGYGRMDGGGELTVHPSSHMDQRKQTVLCGMICSEGAGNRMKEVPSLSLCLPRPHHPRSINKIMLLPKSYFSGSAPLKTAGTVPLFFLLPHLANCFSETSAWTVYSRRVFPVYLSTVLLAMISQGLLLSRSRC